MHCNRVPKYKATGSNLLALPNRKRIAPHRGNGNHCETVMSLSEFFKQECLPEIIVEPDGESIVRLIHNSGLEIRMPVEGPYEVALEGAIRKLHRMLYA